MVTQLDKLTAEPYRWTQTFCLRSLPVKSRKMEKKYDEQFKVVFEAIRALISPHEKPKREIGFEVKKPKHIYGTEARKK